MRVGAWAATEPAGTGGRTASDGELWAGRALVAIVVAAATVTVAVNGDGPTAERLAVSRHVLDLGTLADDPFGSIWYLHSRPPLHNLLLGLVGWSPLPWSATMFVLYLGALLVTGLLLHDVLVRWSTPPLVAGAVSALAMANPALLATIGSAGHEVPVASLVVASLWAAQRYLAKPSGRRLLVASAILSAGALTSPLFHPLWPLVLLALVLAARPVPLRRAALALCLPGLLVGGWMLKNKVVFGEATVASSIGFDLQRGVVGPMEDDDVRDAVAEGRASELALSQPWGPLAHYGDDLPATDPCRGAHDHPAASTTRKPAAVEGERRPNYNNECYLPLYQQARRDAASLVRAHPARYLGTRDSTLVLVYRTAPGCFGSPCTWMDRLYQPLLGKVDGEVSMHDWNLVLVPGAGNDLDITVSMALVVTSAALSWRGAVAAWRLWTTRQARHDWPTGELTWVMAALTVGAVIGVAVLVGFGENARLRSSLDPLLLSLPVAAALRALVASRPVAADTARRLTRH